MRQPSEHVIGQPDGTTFEVTAWGTNQWDDTGVQFRFEAEDGLPVLLVTVHVDDETVLWDQLASIPQVAERLAPRCGVLRCRAAGTCTRFHGGHRVQVCPGHDALTELGGALAPREVSA